MIEYKYLWEFAGNAPNLYKYNPQNRMCSKKKSNRTDFIFISILSLINRYKPIKKKRIFGPIKLNKYLHNFITTLKDLYKNEASEGYPAIWL